MSRYLGELWQFVKVDTFIHLTSGKALYSLATGPFLCKFYTPWTILSFCKFNVIKPFQNKNISLTYYICKDTVDRIQYTNCNKNWNAICKSLFHSFFLGLLWQQEAYHQNISLSTFTFSSCKHLFRSLKVHCNIKGIFFIYNALKSLANNFKWLLNFLNNSMEILFNSLS